MSTPPYPPAQPGRSAAFIVYVLYLLSIPSFALFALAGVILALVSKDGAAHFARSHLDDQIRIWFIAFWWGVALAVLGVIGWILTFILIGFPILWIVGILYLVIMIWFTIKSLLGLLALLDGRPR
ncbi:MAG: hypothetical protein J0L81_16050 [Caulobacterales bacterium]|nr:hypothetical protein [Caulobacterales bacterium]